MSKFATATDVVTMDQLASIEEYWTRRAPSYTDVIHKNLDNGWEDIWANELISHFPEEGDRPLRVLDIGTGPGFYAIILTRRGYNVTAVDYSEGMLDEARSNAGELLPLIDFYRMDAHCLDFPDNSFDVIVSRNLTWNLADPERAYRDWQRVLRPGGRLINFDANWYAYLFSDEKKHGYMQDRINTINAGVEDHGAYEEGAAMENISLELPMGRFLRPQWDMITLLDMGFTKVSADTSVCDILWSDEEKINNASTPGFLICAEKQRS